ncbi:MAG: penicillin-binding protein 2 [Paludibacteraceae bacterium]|nr:penicillin-binding protein 2 [Paludibacteraceae bacterium]
MSDERNNHKSLHRWAVFFGAAILAGFVYTVCVYVSLLVNERDKYLNVIQNNEVKMFEKRGRRGNIYDCRGRLISASLPEYEIYMDLTVDYNQKGAGRDSFPSRLERLCQQLSARFGEETPEHLYRRLMTSYRRNDKRRNDHGVRLLNRILSFEEMQEVLQMPLLNMSPSCGGLVVKERSNRENLFGGMANRVIGAVYGSDDTTHLRLGRYGIEQSMDRELSGTKGVYVRQRVGGKRIAEPIVPAIDGSDVVLTLDMDMQDVCECALRERLVASGARSAFMILMEVETGEIKAMANLTQEKPGVVRQGTNMALAMNNQPGSTFKTVCLMAALETGECDSATVLRVDGGHGVFSGKDVYDSHFYPEKYLPLSAVMARSSNVGMARLMETVYGKNRAAWREFSEDIGKLGYDDSIPIEIIGSARPVIHRYGEYEKWSGNTMTGMSRGYGVQSSALYTLNFYNAIANDGYYVQPHLVSALRRGGEFVKEFDVVKSRSRMCSRGTLEQVRAMLEGVVNRPDGTAYRFASSELFPVAGKTGTARYEMVNGEWKYQISFVGYFPADKPRYSAIVVLMCPDKAYTGMYCGGVFREVAETVWSMNQAR